VRPEKMPPFVVRSTQVVLAVLLVFGASDASAQGKHKRGKSTPTHKDPGGKAGDGKAGDGKGENKPKPTLDFTGINFQGTLHTPQLLYFLDRASEELERASLERRSFIPEMVKSVDEDDL
jgi:hypothetical protein